MPSATTPLAAAGKAAEGEPRVRRPASRPAPQSEPLAEGGFVLNRATLLLAVALTAATLASSPSRAATGFPVTIHAANGPVEIGARPVRIISLSPTATEDLFAVGAGSQVLAVDDQSNYPAAAPRTKLSGFTPNAEAIAGYHPDLVVVSNDGG